MASEEPTPSKELTKNPLGTSGKRVAENIERLRDQQNLTYAALSARLGKLGRPIPPLGLRKIAANTRRVDVDDLVALAVALHVSPASLLMPTSESPNDVVSATVTDDMPAEKLIAWLRAQAPLPEQRDSAPRAWSLPQWLIDREDQLASSDIDWQTELQSQIAALASQVHKLQAHGDD